MLQVEIARLLIFVICIYTSTIQITTTDEIYGSASCKHKKNESGQSINVTCSEKLDVSFAGLNIVHFILVTSSNLILGPHEFHKNGVNSPKSIMITNQPENYYDTSAYRGQLSIHPDIFQHNSNLDHLKIEKFAYFMDDCNTTRNYLFDAKSLSEFSLSVSQYKCWSSLSFSKMPNLQHLYLEIPTFKIIPDIFKPLRNLVKLELSRISNLNILHHTFDGINLKELIIKDSAVESLGNIQITGLQYLHLQRNSIKHISENDFHGLSELTKLIIMGNIETIHEDAFTPLSHLKHLDIQENNIVSFTEYHLRNNFALETFIMAFNEKMKYLPVFKLNATHKSYNIQNFYCYNCGLRAIRNGTFDAMPELITIDLYGNGLRALPQRLFTQLSSLKELHLGRNLISTIPDDMFEGAVELEQLYIGANPLTTLRMSPFLLTPKLKILDMSECQIRTWNIQTPPLNSLQDLTIYGNKLKHLTVDHLKTVPNLQKLSAVDNPIQCDNILRTSINWAISHNITTEFFISQSTFCRSNINNNKTCWEDFEEIICRPEYSSMVEILRRKLQVENWKHALKYNDEPSEEKTTTSIASLTDNPERASSDQSVPSSNNLITDTESLGNISEMKGDKSAKKTISFLVIIVTVVVTILIT